MESDAALLAEFDRLSALLYATLWASGVVLTTYLVTLFVLLRKLATTAKVFRCYPLRLRARAVLSLDAGWEVLVDKAHLDDLRSHRRNARLLLIASPLLLTTNLGIKALRHRWMDRIAAVGDQAAMRIHPSPNAKQLPSRENERLR